jgi:hypothetical protein
LENKQEWLNSLQVGDKVAMDIGSYGAVRYSISQITKITPTRRMTTANGRTFKANGTEYGSGGSFSSVWLQPVTDTIKERIERSYLISHIKGIKFEELSTEQLRKIKDIIVTK